VVLASLLWVTLSLAGLGVLLLQAGRLYGLLRLLGAAYLVYGGTRMLAAALRRRGDREPAVPSTAQRTRSAFLAGLLTTLSNPKSAVFWTSLFIVAVPPAAPAWFYGAILIIVAVQATAWYAFVALALSTGLARRFYRRARSGLEGLAGAVMIAFGLKLAIEAKDATLR
jgi:threonine efflux protein